jgi:hypothetical protein
MEAPQHFVRSRPLAVHQRDRKQSRIELVIRELLLEVAMLNKAIACENPYYAKAAAFRRDNLLRTVENLKGWLEKLAA